MLLADSLSLLKFPSFILIKITCYFCYGSHKPTSMIGGVSDSLPLFPHQQGFKYESVVAL